MSARDHSGVLELERVTRSARGGAHERLLLRDVSLQVHAGELVAVWGALKGAPRAGGPAGWRESGCSTLLRVAAGIERPDGGVVRFDGRPLRGRAGDMLGRGIGFCHAPLRAQEARAVLDELLVGQLARGVPRRLARRRALAALERTGAESCAARELAELDGAEAVRAALARALVLAPRLLVVDDPARGVDPSARDAILALLRSLADEDGLALLVGVGDATALAGADRALSLADGVLRGATVPELAPVVELRRRASPLAGTGA